jgi:DNA-binding MarR family transcriptional regulator
MYDAGMDGGQLHRLGKRLLELSGAVTTQAGDPALTPGELAVLEDALTHPGSSVSEIQARTGFVQSHVSASVARLRQRGLVQTTPDPADGRRTRVRVARDARRAIMARAGRRVDQAIARAVDDPDQARRVTVLLEELARLLL